MRETNVANNISADYIWLMKNIFPFYLYSTAQNIDTRVKNKVFFLLRHNELHNVKFI
jgi:hypothetical protein